ncbi:alpha/beta fold hydrolase [Halocynthiibacter namhaensis]|uniref:alpha/beta fold hydrolase n=1 Tax=Halocynthiibacter namhaensis TaxID=1290553 RepID=UPI0005796609|nr:alpha/beta hydrolase [Halocynthiibacter namhaensis]
MTLQADAYWREWGVGNSREALLLHCGNAHSGAWKGLAGLLVDDLHMVATDHPGHGRSPAWDETRALHDQATQYAAEALPTGDEPVDLVGHSFGGTVALRLALEKPTRVRSLTLIEPVLFCTLKGTAAYQASYALAQPLKALIDDGRREEAARQFTQIWGNGLIWEDLPESQRAYITQCIRLIPASWPTIYFDEDGHFTPDRLRSLSCPVQIIRGEHSPNDITLIHQRLECAFGIQEQVVAGAGHMAPITHPEEIGGLLRQFLNI